MYTLMLQAKGPKVSARRTNDVKSLLMNQPAYIHERQIPLKRISGYMKIYQQEQYSDIGYISISIYQVLRPLLHNIKWIPVLKILARFPRKRTPAGRHHGTTGNARARCAILPAPSFVEPAGFSLAMALPLGPAVSTRGRGRK